MIFPFQNNLRTFSTHLEHHPGLLQQVGPHVGPHDAERRAEVQFYVLPEARTVVVARGFCVADGLT